MLTHSSQNRDPLAGAATMKDTPGVPEVHKTLRQVGGLAVQRVIEIGAGVLFSALIPPRMGPITYGEFALIYTMSMWFSLVGGMGAASTMTRFVPEFQARGDEAGLRKLLGGMMLLRIGNGLLGAGAYFLLAKLWLRSADLVAIGLVAASISVRTVGNLPYTVFLGLNQGARWSAGETMRRSLMVPIIYLFYTFGGLRFACAGLLVIEIAVLAIGTWWARAWFSWGALQIDREFLRPYLRFSAGFLAGNLLIVLFQQGGGPLVHLLSGGGFAEAGFYTIAFSAYLVAAAALWRLVSVFGPLFSSLIVRGESATVTRWVERLLKIMTASAILAAAFTHSLAAPIVHLALGAGFEPVARQLVWMGLAGVFFAPGSISRLLVVTLGRPRISIGSAALQLIAFAVLCVVLVPWNVTLGASIAVVAATAVFSAHSTWSVRQLLRYSLRSWVILMLLGGACSPLLWAWDANSVLRFGVFAAVFLLALVLTRILTPREFTELWKTMRRAPGNNVAA